MSEIKIPRSRRNKKPPNEKQLAALKKHQAPKWEKGQSGNPAGRPKGTKDRATVFQEIADLYFRNKKGFIENPLNPEERKITVEKAMAIALAQRATKGDVNAIIHYFDVLYGKIKEVQQIIPPDVTEKEVDEMTDEEAEELYDGVLKGK